MRKVLGAICASLLVVQAYAQWKPAGDKIKTAWAEQVNPQQVLPEYPRPIMERADWQNLNGEWDYAILGTLCGGVVALRRAADGW